MVCLLLDLHVSLRAERNGLEAFPRGPHLNPLFFFFSAFWTALAIRVGFDSTGGGLTANREKNSVLEAANGPSGHGARRRVLSPSDPVREKPP